MEVTKILDTLYEEIKHGDEDHQRWLKDKIEEFKTKLSELVYTNTDKLTFSEALFLMKNGRLVQREGWNGKKMHIYLEEDFHVLVGKGGGLEHKRKYEPVVIMYNAQGNHQPGWLASQADMLANDWRVVTGI